MTYPDWVLKFKTKGSQIRVKNNNYYLYKVHSVWNKEKKRAQLITDKYIGKITPDGIIVPKHERVIEQFKQVTAKEYGASRFIHMIGEDILNDLKKIFSNGELIFTMAAIRFLHSSPLKNMQIIYDTSYFSNVFDINLSPRVLGDVLRSIGMDRARIVRFLKSYLIDAEYVAIDLTHVFSLSENVISSMIYHNPKNEFSPQIQLLYLFNALKKEPAYYRMLVGSVTSVSSIKITMEESGIKNIIVVGDKGFYSEENVNELEQKNIHYILPLKRNLSIIDYNYNKNNMNFFFFEDRQIWYYEKNIEKRKIILFLDEHLKVEEENDYLRNIKDNKMEEIYSRYAEIGTIAVLTDLNESGDKIYELLKVRVNIDQLFDTFKSVLETDRTYMKDDYELEGWMLVNFVSMMLYYKVYNILRTKKMLKNYSPRDVLLHLSRIHEIKVGDQWLKTEVPRKTRQIIEKIQIHII
ncbi:MAG: transposase [Thermoplasmata archaeon]